jgi:Predicted membrane protein
MFCPKCGSKNEEDSKFCEKCGTNLYDDSEITTENTGSPSNSTGSSVKFLIVICIVLVAGLGIAAGYIFHAHGTTSNSSQTQSNSLSLSNVPELVAQITDGNTATVQYNGMTLDENQCLYILAKAIVMLNSGQTGNIPIKTFGDAADPSGSLTSATITKDEYVDMADRTYTWMNSNGRSPNHTGIDSPGACDLSPDTTLKAFAEVLSEYQSTRQLPAEISI